jgi:DNA primase
MTAQTYDIAGLLERLGIEVERRTRGNYVCPCPFHQDRHPSFAIAEDTGKWICFAGCGQGSVLGLVMQRESISMAAAWRLLADYREGD